MSELERLRAERARVVALCMAAGDWVHRDQVLAVYTDEAGEVPVAALAELVGSGDQVEVHEGWDLDGHDHKPTAYLPEGSPRSESCRACGEDWPCGSAGFEHDIEDPAKADAELADINAQVAADGRVFDAVEAAVREIRAITHISAAARELVAAWDARRALTGEQKEGA